MKKVHRVIKFNEKAWIKPYINKVKLTLKNTFSSRKHRDMELVTTVSRRIYLVSEPNYHWTIFFPENLLAIEMRKTKVLMTKPGYLVDSILELSKIVLCKLWDHYLKLQYSEKAKLCYIDTDKNRLSL